MANSDSYPEVGSRSVSPTHVTPRTRQPSDSLGKSPLVPNASDSPEQETAGAEAHHQLKLANSNSSEQSIAHILSASWPFIDHHRPEDGPDDCVGHEDPEHSNGTHLDPKTPLLSQSQPTSRRTSVVSTNFNKFTQNYIIPAAKWAYSPMTKKKKRIVVDDNEYSIEYSVFKPLAGLPPISNEKEWMHHWKSMIDLENSGFMMNGVGLTDFKYPENYVTRQEFMLLVQKITGYITTDELQPERISQGSSGSYFVYGKKAIESDIQTTMKVGIFKPKDEEPYGPLSPKWTKWLHRTFFPCFFGRSCLIPNLGYISEAAASVLDRQLLSYIVPYTDVIHLSSPSFFYRFWDKSKLPPKIGSFQLFLNGYIEAQKWFRLYPFPPEEELLQSSEIRVAAEEELHENFLNSRFVWSQEVLQQFREELEKLVILDYIMRNTDRGLDNWMIKISWRTTLQGKAYKKMKPFIKIGAIDSGLAFPWKRPDEWRSFPFGWLFLPLNIIGQPFSMKTRKHYLPLLTSKYWWEQTVVKLREIFEVDNDFKERMWLKQLAVLKGQAFNVVEVLKLSQAGPLELTRSEHMLVWDDTMYIPKSINDINITRAMESSIHDLGQHNYGSTFQESNNAAPIDINGHKIQQSGYPSLQEGYAPKAYNARSSTPTSPLAPKVRRSSVPAIRRIREDGDEPSGYDYNLTCTEDEREAQESNRKAIIERLEKVDSKPPFFTWC